MQKFFISVLILIGLLYYSCGYTKLFNSSTSFIGLNCSNNSNFSKFQIKLGHVIINGHTYNDQLVYIFYQKKYPIIKFLDDLSLVSEDNSSAYKFNKWLNTECLTLYIKKITFKMMFNKTFRVTNFIFTKKTRIDIIDHDKNKKRAIPYYSPLVD